MPAILSPSPELRLELQLIAEHGRRMLDNGKQSLRLLELHADWTPHVDVIFRNLFPNDGVESDTERGEWLRLRRDEPEDCSLFDFVRHASRQVSLVEATAAQLESILRRPRLTASSCHFHRREVEPRPADVFVLMPFGPPDDSLAVFESITRAVGGMRNAVGDPMRARRADGRHGHDVMQDVYEGIVGSACVIVETTGRNSNVLVELGMSLAFGKPMILVTRDDFDVIPFDLQRFRHFQFAMDANGMRSLTGRIENALEELIGASRSRGMFSNRDGGGGGIFVNTISAPSVAEGTR